MQVWGECTSLYDEAKILVKEIAQQLTWEGRQIDTEIGYENYYYTYIHILIDLTESTCGDNNKPTSNK